MSNNIKLVTTNKDGKSFVLFFHEYETNGCCSNWFKSNFMIDGNTFNCVEQYMMYKKAMLFNDSAVANDILAETKPNKMKSYGRRVKNFDNKVWNNEKYNIVLDGVRAKFMQDNELREQMKSLKSCDYFVECSPYDDIWGVKLRIGDPKVLNPDTWNGENLLGKALKEVYDEIQAQE